MSIPIEWLIIGGIILFLIFGGKGDKDSSKPNNTDRMSSREKPSEPRQERATSRGSEGGPDRTSIPERTSGSGRRTDRPSGMDLEERRSLRK